MPLFIIVDILTSLPPNYTILYQIPLMKTHRNTCTVTKIFWVKTKYWTCSNVPIITYFHNLDSYNFFNNY